MTDSIRSQAVLFVCMGNICRSPSAEGFFRQCLAQAGLEGLIETDSAGTHSYHLGNPPDSRAIGMASEFGVDITDLRARRIEAEDFENFDLVIAMDDHNLRTIEQFRRNAGMEPGRAEVRLMMEYSPQYADQPEVPDPYYGNSSDFRYMCELLEEATTGLLNSMRDSSRGAGDGSSV